MTDFPSPNVEQLTPLSFLARSASIFPKREAIREGDRSLNYAEFAEHAQYLGRALKNRLEPGDRVAYLSPNSPELLIGHFAVPLAGAVLVPLNTRLQSAEIAYILEHSAARILLVDPELRVNAEGAMALLDIKPELFSIGDSWPGATAYSEILNEGAQLAALPWRVEDENSVIALNYTSGTTGRPKGVMYTHRGAALNSLGFLHHAKFDGETRYLWTLPMFHCNGWCSTWAVTAAGGLHVTIRAVREETVWESIDNDGITHLCGAPTVLSIVATAPQSHTLEQPLMMVAGGAPPSPSIIERLETMGATVLHGYGLTEVYGPFTICEYQSEWSQLSLHDRAAKMSRQGVSMIQSGEVRVVDEELVEVPFDGVTVGEIVMRGNNVMLGYFRDEEATRKAFNGGWFHSGDLGVRHPDGYIELRDRAKDVIISGGENISSIEVENALLAHPEVLDAGVVAIPDEHWGERPLAFLVCRTENRPDDASLRRFLSEQLARFKVPDRFEWLDQLPRTSTGKVLKGELRGIAERMNRKDEQTL